MQYSEGMANMIKMLLQVNSKMRPSCDKILKMEIVCKKVEKLGLDDNQCKTLVGDQLLGTIRIPKNLGVLREKLPKPHYYSNISNHSDSELPSLTRERCGLKQTVSSNAIKLLIIPNNAQPLSSRLPSKYDHEKYKIQNNLDTSEENSLELPGIKRVNPIRRPPVSYNKYPYKALEELGKNHLYPYGKNVLIEQAVLKNKSIKRRCPVLPKYNPPAVQRINLKVYKDYYTPIAVQPPWWG